MTNNEILQSLEVVNQEKVLVVAELWYKDFLGNDFILNKYFVNNKGYFTKMFHMPRLTKEVYEDVVKTMKKVSEENMHFETASQYFKEKVMTYIVAKDFKVNPKKVSFKGYEWKEDYYQACDPVIAAYYAEDAFREPSEDLRNLTLRDIYIKHCKDVSFPVELVNSLYKFCVKMIRNRLAILLDIENCFSFLNRIIKKTEQVTEYEVATLQNYYNRFVETLKDKEVSKFIKEDKHSDLDIFDKYDIISTYQRLLRTLSDIREGTLEYCRDFIHNDQCPYEDLIIANDYMLVEIDIVHENYDEDCVEDKVLVY